jgi:hypothetical protein
MHSLTPLFQQWYQLQPAHCFPFRKLYALNLGGKSHVTVNPGDMKPDDLARLQGAVQHAIAYQGWNFSLECSSTSKGYAAIIWGWWHGFASRATEVEPAIALLTAYLKVLEVQVEIEVKAEELSPVEQASRVLEEAGIDTSQGVRLKAPAPARALLEGRA